MNGRVLVSFLMSVFFGVAVMASGPELGTGGVYVKGATNSYGTFQLSLTVKQAPADMFKILAVKIYTNPSHTLMFALVDDSAPVKVLQAVQAESPRGMAVGTIGAGAANVGLSAPPVADGRVTVEYVVLRGQEISPYTISNISVTSISEFEFLSQPDGGGGGFKHCAYCGSNYCGCITCSVPEFTLCCPACTMACGLILCP